MWKLLDNAEGQTKRENAVKAKKLLEALNGQITGLIKLEVGIDLIGSENTGDIVLYSEFESEAAMQGYLDHPEHVKLIPFMKAIRSDRFWIDYKV